MIYGTGTIVICIFALPIVEITIALHHPSGPKWIFAPDSKDPNMEIDME